MPTRIYRALRISTLLATASFAALAPATGSAAIRGEAELGYVTYEAETNGKKSLDASSFMHRYSVLHTDSGDFYRGRVGRYDYSLGYEWGAFDTKIKGSSLPGGVAEENPSISEGRILYSGELVIDPAEVPMRLRVYSHDTKRLSFTRDSLSTLSDPDLILTPDLTTNLQGGGMHIDSGATLLLGVKNGHTNGYNAIFRHLPLIMLDYRDEIRRDLKSQTPVDTRLRRLAFVSLNKRDNWFHYRTTSYTDYLNPGSGFTETQYQLGTVDHALQRRWINLTNWIKISADGQLTERHGETGGARSEEYALNAFAILARRDWEARTFTNFTRTADNDGLRLERNIPLYASGIWGQETDWRVSFSNRERRDIGKNGGVSEESNVGLTLKVDTFKRSSFTLSPAFSVESSESGDTSNLALEGKVETASTSRFSKILQLSAGYTVRNFRAESAQLGESSYVNHLLVGRVGYRPSSSLHVTFEENISAASGQNAGLGSNRTVTPNNNFGTASDTVFQRDDTVLDEYTRYVTSLGASWTPVARLAFSLSATHDFLLQPGAPTDTLTVINGGVDYTADKFRMRMDNRVSWRSARGGDTSSYHSRGSLEYTPGRALDASLRYTFDRSFDSVTTTFFDLTQRFGYTLFKTKGAFRRLVELSEEFSFNETETTGRGRVTNKRLFLGAKYYPLQSLFISASGRYSLIDPGSTKELFYNAGIGITFRKLQASVDYSYGRRTGSDTRIEKRLAANVKKFF